MRHGIVSAFQCLLTDPGEWRASLESLEFLSLNVSDAIELEQPFSEEGVEFALKQLNREKASMPNGYTILFDSSVEI